MWHSCSGTAPHSCVYTPGWAPSPGWSLSLPSPRSTAQNRGLWCTRRSRCRPGWRCRWRPRRRLPCPTGRVAGDGCRCVSRCCCAQQSQLMRCCCCLEQAGYKRYKPTTKIIRKLFYKFLAKPKNLWKRISKKTDWKAYR